MSLDLFHQVSLTLGVERCPLDRVRTKIQSSRLKLLVKMHGPEFQIANRDQHLGLRRVLRGVERPESCSPRACTLPEKDLLMRAKLKDKGDLAGVSSRAEVTRRKGFEGRVSAPLISC